MAQGIVLAGGFSSRAGMNKMTLPYRGVPLVARAVDVLSPFCDAIVVVTGRFHDDIVEALAGRPKTTFVRNPLFENGMFDSVRCGVGATTGDVLILPGDMPLIEPSTVAKILSATGDIRVPIYRRKTGHPIFIAARLRTPLLAYRGPDGLRGFRDREGFTSVPTDDPGILIDVDSLDDYRKLTNEGGEHPDAD
ncbi:MAG: nucleotidyltransferase family protein [Candidatus Izemoplasmatales bacterium]